jgi:two-component system, NtrC family, sensor kinase
MKYERKPEASARGAEHDAATAHQPTTVQREEVGAALPDFFGDSPVAAFAIDVTHVVTHWNKACESMTGIASEKIIGSSNHWQPYYVQPQKVLADFVLSNPQSRMVDAQILDGLRPVPLATGAYEIEDFFPHLGESGRWIAFSASPLRDKQGHVVGAVQTMQDVTEVHVAEEALRDARVNVERLAMKRVAMLSQACALQGKAAASTDIGDDESGAENRPAAFIQAAEPRKDISSGLKEAHVKSGPDSEGAPALSAFFDGSPVPAFAIDVDHVVTHWNKACERTTGVPASSMIGTRSQWAPFYPKERPVLADLIVSGTAEEMVDTYYRQKFRRSPIIPGAFEAEDFFPQMGENGRWLFFSAAPLRDQNGRVVGAIETLQDVTKRKLAEKNLHKVQVDLEHLVAKRTAQLAQANSTLEEDIRQREAAEAELLRRNAELTELNVKLSMAQEQLMQSEKLASIGQLAAGVAHEINNPIGYIFSNFTALEHYLEGLLGMLSAYEEAEADIASPSVLARLKSRRLEVELDYLKSDLPNLMEESMEGIIRVRKIVQDLKDFSRVDTNLQWQCADLHQGIDSTLNIVNNEIKYKADIVKEYGSIPEVECLSSQINQVILNIVVNAAHAIGPERGTITIRTGAAADVVWVEISDNGCGIPAENMTRIFDPFFTTKPVGQGTGLGLSLSYGIVQKHQGSIDVRSVVGQGTTFRLALPIRHTATQRDGTER